MVRSGVRFRPAAGPPRPGRRHAAHIARSPIRAASRRDRRARGFQPPACGHPVRCRSGSWPEVRGRARRSPGPCRTFRRCPLRFRTISSRTAEVYSANEDTYPYSHSAGRGAVRIDQDRTTTTGADSSAASSMAMVNAWLPPLDPSCPTTMLLLGCRFRRRICAVERIFVVHCASPWWLCWRAVGRPCRRLRVPQGPTLSSQVLLVLPMGFR